MFFLNKSNSYYDIFIVLMTLDKINIIIIITIIIISITLASDIIFAFINYFDNQL
jgi:hypothetical protein